ncbi:MAG: biotin carboxylase [Deltaproteobacteria bacterium]|nr:biotin carboxylase [Deltaproteobacteria bacterium]
MSSGEHLESADWYAQNPYIHRERRLAQHPSAWARGFACGDVRPLIVCRGPVRKEAQDVFREMGITACGILVSDKDSIVYTRALAPEIRTTHGAHVHQVRDYAGSTKTERVERVAEIIGLCRAHGYTHVFAGYGFMAEDEEFVRALEHAGVGFIGPRAAVHQAAGRKDEAKRTALAERVSVTPGISNATARCLLRKHPDVAALRAVAAAHALAIDPAVVAPGADLPAAADAVLEASYASRVDLFTVDELGEEIARCAAELFVANPGSRVRLKAIGGGGGKGQRILDGVAVGAGDLAVAAASAAERAPKAVREILAEVKAGGVGDNKNILLELNVEQTRHNEIQLLGNGEWCVALGGRDCSLQMHEQKLLEVSITTEALEAEVAKARAAGREAKAQALETDLATLREMETEAERFGRAVGLNSASTFECIVEGARHYFMEVNTRIQVEHRVTELCYALRFANPADPTDFFEVWSLIEAMAIIARHDARLPRPTRVRREGAAIEARLNATNRSLSPHAGGVIHSWSDPIEHEVRDDQGICVKNPDTGVFVRYRLAGAYDSNIALLVTAGDDRAQAFGRLSEVLRRAKLRGADLQTNLEFQYGLLEWFRARDVYARPTTRFVVPYLTLLSMLAEEVQHIDLEQAWKLVAAAREAGAGDAAAKDAMRHVVARQETLVLRPLAALFGNPHVLSAWLSAHRGRYVIDREGSARVRWVDNPIEVLRDTYALLNMDYRSDEPAALVIWDHDHALLGVALGFYERLAARLGVRGWAAIAARLDDLTAPAGFDDALWARTRSSHVGFQSAVTLLGFAALAGDRVDFEALWLEDDLTVTIPPALLDPAAQARAKQVLSPPPEESPDTLVAVSGGMFYAQESPDKPPFVRKGSRFKAGDPLYMIEVMKMFNTVYAAFSGTVEEVLMSGAEGTVVRRGEPLFRVRADEQRAAVDPAAVARQRATHTHSYVDAVLTG